MNIVAAAVFIVKDVVRWDYALAMAVAAIVGGYFGARMSLLLRPVIVRWVVIVIGFSLAAHYFMRCADLSPKRKRRTFLACASGSDRQTRQASILQIVQNRKNTCCTVKFPCKNK